MNRTTWTCFCCDGPAPPTEDMPDNCSRCGGVWVRQIHLTSWQHMKSRIRQKFTRSRTFDNADELIEWLEQ